MENYTFDLHRILFGELPIAFLAEILFRTVVLYLYTLLVLRLMGRRNVGELTPLELVIVISLGSAVGDPMFYPKVPLLHGMAVVTLVGILQGGFVFFTAQNELFEATIKGKPIAVVCGGLLELENMNRVRVSQEELFMELRQLGYQGLGQIAIAFIEPDGKMSAFPYTEESGARSGVPLIPPRDSQTQLFEAGETVEEKFTYGCWNCGNLKFFAADDVFEPCSRCGRDVWTIAEFIPLDQLTSNE